MDYRRFTHALVRTPRENMADGLTTQTFGALDFERALRQHEAYCAALRACGLCIEALPGEAAYPDGQFVEDTAVIYQDAVIITQPGAVSRRGETAAIQQALSHMRQFVMSGEATLDGGDVLICAERVLIGLSGRTNAAGARFLRDALHEMDATLRIDFVPFRGVLHLKTGVTELAPGILLKAPALITDYAFDFAEVITLPAAESYAADVLPVNGRVIIPAGYPTVADHAARCYADVIALEMHEFAKMDGGLTCLSLLYTP